MDGRQFQCFVFVGTSVDGFIARADGAVDWLTPRAGFGDAGYSEFVGRMDAIVLGRRAYESIAGLDAWPYELPVYVLSGSLDLTADPRVTVVRDLESAVTALGESGVRNVYVDGGETIRSFLIAGLIDELTITVAPVLIGWGIPLFGMLPADIQLEVTSSTVIGDGLVQTTYRMLR